MKLAEFNREANPNDSACYRIESSAGNIKDVKFSEMIGILRSCDDPVIYMKIPKGLLIIETESEAVVNLIVKRKEKLLVVKKKSKYQIYTLSSFDKNTTNNILACGCNGDTLVNTKGGTEIILPFHSPRNTSPVFNNLEIVYENEIGKLPFWLYPLRRNNSNTLDGLELPITGNTKRLLLNHILAITGKTKDEQRELLEFINDNLVETPLTKAEIEDLNDSLSDSLLSQFMNKNDFYHDKFGDYVIQSCSIKKDEQSGDLYFYNSKKNIYTNDPDFLRGYITRLLPRLKKFQKDEAINYISDYLEYDAVEFNSDQFNVVFKNGVLNVLDLTFEEMSPEHLESIQIDAEWDEKAYSETADEFFNNATCGDAACEQLLYEAIGYSMLKTNELAKAFMLIGNGRNGKSTYLEIIKKILGKKNYASLSLKDMSNQFRISQLQGKLASLAGDISAQPISDSDLLKSISAGEDITIEKKYKDAYTGAVFATLFFACNKLPRTPDTSDGYYRRWCIVPFNADLNKISNVDGFAFKKKLLEQESINYIAHKAVMAINRVMTTTKDFTKPQAVLDTIAQYKIDNSSFLSWFHENLNGNEERIKNLTSNNTVDRAYDNYTEWCKSANRQCLSKTNFKSELKDKFKIEIQ